MDAIQKDQIEERDSERLASLDGHAGADLELIGSAARDAGLMALSMQAAGAQSWIKADNTPVTSADLALDKMLFERLKAARPEYGWLSEESEDDQRRLSAKRCFIVDPIDGTRGFINGLLSWAVSIAIIEDNRPYAGAIYYPDGDRLFSAIAGVGAWQNGRSMPAKEVMNGDPLSGLVSIAGPKSFIDHPLVQSGAIDLNRKIASLALRLVMVATGDFDAACAHKNTCDWDIAAADLILAECGCALVNSGGMIHEYNRQSVKKSALIAAAQSAIPSFCDIFKGYLRD